MLSLWLIRFSRLLPTLWWMECHYADYINSFQCLGPHQISHLQRLTLPCVLQGKYCHGFGPGEIFGFFLKIWWLNEMFKYAVPEYTYFWRLLEYAALKIMKKASSGYVLSWWPNDSRREQIKIKIIKKNFKNKIRILKFVTNEIYNKAHNFLFLHIIIINTIFHHILLW